MELTVSSASTAESTNNPPSGLWRSGRVTDVARVLSIWALKYHRIVIDGGENMPLSGAALILPKHRAYRDILIEGIVIHRLARRYATYVMKVGLYGILELVGGVKIVRPQDIRRIKDRQQRRRRIEWARSRNQQTLDYLTWLYTAGECVVSHPEGTRCADFLGPLQKQVVEHLMSVEAATELRIPLIPMGLEYENIRAPRSRVFVRIGTPMYADEFADQAALMNELESRLRTLSFADES
jgi:1-acyl-sn-glycerol-3-phosphate acyltransferase